MTSLSTHNRLDSCWDIRPVYKELLVFFFFIAIVCWFFPAMVYQGQIPNGGDVNGLYYPQMKFLGDELRSGRFPLWNPFIFSGTPFFANPHTGSAHLFHLILFALFPAERAFGLDIALHFVLAGWFVYLLVRCYGVSRPAAVLSGICFMFSQFVVTKILIPRGFFSAPFFPLMLYGIERVIQKRNFSSFLICSIAAALLLLCGDPQTVYIVLLTSLIYLVGRIFSEYFKYEIRENLKLPWRFTGNILYILFIFSLIGYGVIKVLNVEMKGLSIAVVLLMILIFCYSLVTRIKKIGFEWRNLFSTSGILVLALMAGLGLAAVQIVPAIKLLPTTVRAGFPESDYFRMIMFPQLWIAIIHDFFTGWGMGDFEISTYIGTIPIFLMIAALFLPGQEKTFRRFQFIFVILSIWSLSLVFGEKDIVRFFIHHIPIFSTFFVLHRYLIVYVLSASILAGFAFERFIQFKSAIPTPSVSLFGFLLFCAGFIVFWNIIGLSTSSYRFLPAVILIFLYLLSSPRLFPHWLFTLAIISGTLFELTPQSASYSTDMMYISPQKLYPPTQVSQFLRKDSTLFRYFSVEDTTHHAPTNKPPHLSNLLLPNTAAVYRDYDTQGFDPIFLNSYRELIQRINQNQPQRNPYDDPLHYAIINPSDSPLISLLNVKYVISEMPLDLTHYHLLLDRGEQVYLNDRFVPRAFLVHRIKISRDENINWQWVQSQDFNPTQTVVLNENLGKLTEQRSNEIGTTGKKFSSAHSIRVQSESPTAGNEVHIWVDNQDIVDNLPGYTIAVVNPETVELESVKNFRTDSSPEEVMQMVQLISSIDTGKMVVVASRGNTNQFMTMSIMSTFQSIGAKGIVTPYSEQSCTHVILGIKGSLPGQAMELENLPKAELSIPYSIPAVYRYDSEDSTMSGESDSVTITKYLPNRIRCRTSSSISGILVLSEIYEKGWQVYVDNLHGTLARGDGILRAVYVSKGNHTIDLVYWPEGLTWGIIVTSTTLLLLLCAIGIRIGVLLKKRKIIKQEQKLIEKVEKKTNS